MARPITNTPNLGTLQTRYEAATKRAEAADRAYDRAASERNAAHTEKSAAREALKRATDSVLSLGL